MARHRDNRPFVILNARNHNLYLSTFGQWTENRSIIIGFWKREEAYSFARAQGHDSSTYHAVRGWFMLGAGVAKIDYDGPFPNGEVLSLSGPVICDNVPGGGYRFLDEAPATSKLYV